MVDVAGSCCCCGCDGKVKEKFGCEEKVNAGL